MKNIFAAAVIATATLCTIDAVSTLTADARPNKAECGMVSSRIEVCHKPVGATNIEILVMDHVADTAMWAERNCQTNEVWWNNELDGFKNAGYTQQEVFDLTRTACNF